MKVKFLFSYCKDVIPPRCRKPRTVRFDDGEFIAEIPEISAAEAPIAIRSEGSFVFRDEQTYSVNYRFWKNALWAALNLSGAEPTGRYANQDNWDWPAIPEVVDLRGDCRQCNSDLGIYVEKVTASKEEVEAALRRFEKSNILIDGVPYRPAGEPRYVVMTFGFGQNHGGTAVMIDSRYNSNIGKDRYFNLLDRDKAIALATELALGRGDDKSLPIVPHGPVWNVLIPEAIKVQPSGQHGDGDPFLNSLEAVAQVTGGAPVTGLIGGLMAISG